MKKYHIECTEEQLRLIMNAVEDWSRFLMGQCELWNATLMLDNEDEIQEKLKEIEPLVVPELPRGGFYRWNGIGCSNSVQRKKIAMSYGIWRQIAHFFSVKNNINDCYRSETLTCDEQGELITIKEIEDEN